MSEKEQQWTQAAQLALLHEGEVVAVAMKGDPRIYWAWRASRRGWEEVRLSSGAPYPVSKAACVLSVRCGDVKLMTGTDSLAAARRAFKRGDVEVVDQKLSRGEGPLTCDAARVSDEAVVPELPPPTQEESWCGRFRFIGPARVVEHRTSFAIITGADRHQCVPVGVQPPEFWPESVSGPEDV